VDRFLTHLVVSRDVPLPVSQIRVKLLIQLPDRRLTSCATDPGRFAG